MIMLQVTSIIISISNSTFLCVYCRTNHIAYRSESFKITRDENGDRQNPCVVSEPGMVEPGRHSHEDQRTDRTTASTREADPGCTGHLPG